MFLAVLFIIIKEWKQPKYLLTMNGQIKYCTSI